MSKAKELSTLRRTDPSIMIVRRTAILLLCRAETACLKPKLLKEDF